VKVNSLTDCFVLGNGVKIPCVGFGTWQTENGKTAVNVIKMALNVGYRHIDTAAAYGNEKSVGRALKESSVPRTEVFVTSKLPNTEHTYKKAKVAFRKTLEDLQLEYLDLYLIHWPNPVDYRDRWAKSNEEVWGAFEEFYNANLIHSIGVSNFHAHHLDALLETAKIRPMVNQIRLCPGDSKDKVVKDSLDRGIFIEAYSPLGGSDSGSILNAPLVINMAEKYNKNTAQICIRWCLQRGFLPLPKSTSEEHIRANAQVFDFEISNDDIKKLDIMKDYPDPFPHPDEIKW
jgi:diketogulonate reductase-like aldo/keto reductase